MKLQILPQILVSKLSESLRYYVLHLAIICALAIVVQAQSNNQPQRGLYSLGSFAVGDIDIIDTQSGNVTLNLPLASLPSGRGGSSGASVSLMYNSKIWDPRPINVPISCSDQACQNWRYDLQTSLEQSLRGGWRFPLWHKLEVINKDGEYYQPYGGGAQSCAYNGSTSNGSGAAYRIKVRMQMPDGSTVDFRRQESHGDGGYYGHDPEGRTYFCRVTCSSCAPSTDQGGTTPATYAPQTYYSTDGSYLRLDITFSAPLDQYGTRNRNWTLRYPDGTRIESSGRAEQYFSNSYLPSGNPVWQRVTDRNANVTMLETIGDSGNPGTRVSDALGRSITIQNNSITATGAGGEQLVWTLSWKQIPVNKTYNNGGTHPGFSQINTLQTSLNVLDQIILPAQLGGQAYTL